MLRSWIDRATQRLLPANSAGIYVGRNTIGAAEVAASADGRWEVRSLSEAKLDTPLYSGVLSQDTSEVLSEAITKVAGSLSRRYLPVHLSLPDAVVRTATFELDQIPKARSAQLDLVRFRFGRESGGDPGVCAYQELGTEGAKHLLFSSATDAAWQRCIHDALTQCGVVVWTSAANANRQFNRFHDRMTQASGALVSLTSEAWSLWLWDALGRPRYARARWRASDDDHRDIAMDVERSILAYVHGHPERTITHVYVVAGSETDGIAAALDVRLREPCIKLSEDDGLSFDPAIKHDAASSVSSLAAALDR